MIILGTRTYIYDMTGRDGAAQHRNIRLTDMCSIRYPTSLCAAYPPFLRQISSPSRQARTNP